MRKLLLGDEAIAQAAIDSGLSGVYAYPGTPSTEITEFIQLREEKRGDAENKICCRWATNEKTAMEGALGMSYMGKRALVCMKHVGMNVAADPFVNSAMTGVNGGLVVVAADDPSMHSSQNEQDSRFYGKFQEHIQLSKNKNQELMNDIIEVADLLHNGVISFLRENYSSLTKHELCYCGFIALGFSPESIRVLYNHSNINSIYTTRRKIRSKLSLNAAYRDLEAYILELSEKLGQEARE